MEKIKFPEFPWRSLIPLPNHTPSDFAERTTSHNKPLIIKFVTQLS